MNKELEDLGLSEKEAKVYLAALEIGRATADQLAKHAKIVRPTAYVQLDSLMKKGLMSTYEEGKKTYFAPESPELLKRLLMRQQERLRTKENELTNLLPELLRQYESAGERPVVRFFPGKEGITVTREEALTTKEKKVLTVFSYDHLRKVFSEKELDDYSEKRRKLGIHSRGIHLHKPYFSKAGLDELTERRFLSPEALPLTIDITIFDDKTALRSLEGSLFGVIIESKQIASNMKMIFNFLWQSAKGPEELENK
ncbi:MAG: helix-turn-helix domain-containing protein [Candidatus Paceibacterota bacterium]